jgi:O-antigen ligase
MVVGSRSVTIMFIVLILLAIACTSNVKRLFPVILVTAIISILSALAFSGNFIQKFTASPDLLTGRLKLYTEVITGISQRKLFGWGLDSFSTIHPLFQEVTMGNYSRAHSDILQVLWDFGLVGVSLLIATVLLFIKLRPKDNFSKYIYISLIGIALLSLVDFPLSNPAVLTSFCLGWVLLYQRLNYRNTLD